MTTVAEALAQAVQHHNAGRLAEAEALYRQILAAVPDQPDALHLLGVMAHRAGDNAGAEKLLARAAQRQPGRADLNHSHGVVLYALGRRDEAAAAFARALALEPQRRDVHYALGRCRFDARDFAGAAASFRAELAIADSHVQALQYLGAAAYELERLDEAEACFRRITERWPGEATAWNNLGAILLERGDADAAAAHYDAAVAHDPAYSQAYSNRLMCEQYRAGVTAESLLALSRGWEARYASREAPSPPAPRRAGRLRVGFVAPDFCRAPVGYFLVGLMEALDQGEIETVLYSDTLRADDLTQRIAGAAGTWREVRGIDHQRLTLMMRQDGLDALFDLAGHTRDNRLPVFAARVAPVQVSWAGYVGTTGLARMDYLLADRFQVPPGEEGCYGERVVRMPHGYVTYSPPDYAPAVTPLPAERQRIISFGAFHNVAKTVASLGLWARVLAAVPRSRIVLKYKKLDDPRVSARIRTELAAAGVAPTRIVIEGTSPHVAMLQRYGDVDIALDAIPYSGGLTTCEALWMGVPVVTLPGRTFAGRHSLSHLMNVGLKRLVARDAADYVAICTALAGDLPALAQLRWQLRSQMAFAPLCDGAAFARDFTRLLRQITRG